MASEDASATRMVQRELSRRAIDISLCEIRVSHGVCFIRGSIGKLRGHDFDLQKEMGIIQSLLRQKPGIREVIVEATFRR